VQVGAWFLGPLVLRSTEVSRTSRPRQRGVRSGELGRGVKEKTSEREDARGADQYRPKSCRKGKAARMAPKLKYPAGPADVSPDYPPKPKAKHCPEHSVIAVLQ